MANGPASPCRHPVWLCRTCGTDLENWPELKAKLALTKEQERAFRQHEWTADDWKDFHCTLEAFKGRVMERVAGTMPWRMPSAQLRSLKIDGVPSAAGEKE